MPERTGRIVFINSHDYTSDVTGEQWVGCLTSLQLDDGKEISLYTKSVHIQQTVEMAYATGRKVTVSYWDTHPNILNEQELIAQAIAERRASTGLFIIKAIWTLE
jgi:hypothetical protein